MPASAALRARCRATASAVGYPVPCPTRVPAGLVETGGGGPSGCVLHIIGPGGNGGCAKSWHGWVVGSSQAADAHLVITASPRPLRNYARVVNGPAWYPNRVRPLRSLTINGWRMRAVDVPAGSNDGSSFANHLALVWTVGAHTYAIGFHNVHGFRQTLRLDEALARGIRLVGAGPSQARPIRLGRSEGGRPIVAVRAGDRKPDTTLRIYAHEWKYREAQRSQIGAEIERLFSSERQKALAPTAASSLRLALPAPGASDA